MKTLAMLLGVIGVTLLMSAAAWRQARPSVEERLIRVEEGIRSA